MVAEARGGVSPAGRNIPATARITRNSPVNITASLRRDRAAGSASRGWLRAGFAHHTSHPQTPIITGVSVLWKHRLRVDVVLQGGTPCKDASGTYAGRS